MIRHVVLVRFKPDVAQSEIAAIFAALDALGAKLAGFVAFAAGPNISPERLDRGYTHAFTADFADAAMRDAYLAHPDHVVAGGRLVAAAQGGIDGLAVIDIAA